MDNHESVTVENDVFPKITERVSKMTDEEAQARYEELKEKIVPTVPNQLAPGETPKALPLEKLHEYYLLQKRLGVNFSLPGKQPLGN
jgi:hypothetical protein